VRLLHFLVGQRAIRGLIGERIRQAFVTGRNALTAIHVKQPDGLQQVPAGRRDFRRALEEMLTQLRPALIAFAESV
jgi:hypothetical protein